MADKALLIGINDYKFVGKLRGCEADVARMKRLITGSLGFKDQNVKILLNQDATKAKINRQMKWLFKDLAAGNRVLLHFSGHGSYTSDTDGEDDGGTDELICLYDMDFDDPESYIIDDDLRHWTQARPEGARLVVVLDCCNSGTGTRLVMAPESSTPRALLAQVSAARAVDDGTARGLSASEDVATSLDATLDPDDRSAVLARFVPPPAHIQQQRARGLGIRQLMRGASQGMNHILLAACRDDQTAADALIGGGYNGAFSYHLCETLGQPGGTGLDVRTLRDRVSKALVAGHFPQVPQFEGAAPGDTLFGAPTPDATVPQATSPSSPTGGGQSNGKKRPPSSAQESLSPATSRPPDDPRQLVDLLTRIVGTGEGLTADDRRTAMGLFAQLIGGEASDLGGDEDRAAGGRHLVYIHGINEHVAGYSNPWWAAVQGSVPGTYGAGTLGSSRHEVLWSNLVNDRALDAVPSREIERERLAEEIRETLEDRIDRQAMEAAPASEPGDAPRALTMDRASIRIPGLSSIDDFAVYMLDDAMRARIIRRFTETVRPLLERDAELDIISHSWGTVVAYEGLREMEDAGLTAPRVRTFFTVGAALSIVPVKLRLRPANRDGRRPALVRRWVNINARGDVIGGPLQGRPYAVDNDFPNLEAFGCRRFLGLVNPSCAHASYFQSGNVAVNRDVFGRFLTT